MATPTQTVSNNDPLTATAALVSHSPGEGRPFLMPWIADLEGESFEDSAAQLANRADRSAPEFGSFHASGVASR